MWTLENRPRYDRSKLRYPSAEPKVTSMTDPAAAWANKAQMKVLFAYGINCLIDLAAAIIVDVEATPARWSAEVDATKTMLERTQACFHLKPQRLAADSAYGSGLMIGWLMQRQIEPHIPLLDHEHQTNGFFTRADFIFDAAAQCVHLPRRKASAEHGPGPPGWHHALSCEHQGLPRLLTESALHER